MIISMLKHCTLLHFVCDLKAAQTNVQRNLNRKFMLYKFKLGDNTARATKNICCVKGDGVVDHSTVSR